MKLFDMPIFPEAASTIAGEVDALYFFALAVSAFFSLLIAVVIFYFFMKYRRREAREVGISSHGSMLLEVTWSVIPLIIVMFLFAWGAKVFMDIRTVPDNAREYFATGKQWMWKIQHPEGHREINQLHIPAGVPIKMTMTSEDVIHSFFIPAFRVKQDVLPGRYTTLWFEATKPGTYHLFCTEYCGAEHSMMIGSVTVMSPDEYQDWLAGEMAGLPPAQAGEQIFEQYVCNSCHMSDGSGRGPTLDGIYGKEVLMADGKTAMVDDDYLRESILRPHAKTVAGYEQLMPTYQGQINETGIMQLIAYIKTLTDSGEAGETAAPGETTAAAEATEPESTGASS